MIEAVIFDMDGLLIDSEPFWREAELQVFPEVGITITEEMWKETIGIRLNEVIDRYYAMFPWNLEKFSKREVENRISDHVIDLIYQKGVRMEGVGEILDFFQKKPVKMALASSSDFKIIDAILDKLELRSYFGVIHSAEAEPFGKPHPAVYISTSQKLNIAPLHCLAFEDSINGLLSAKSARMKCVAVPGDSLKNDKRLGIADVVLSSLADFDEEIWQSLN